jgi:hypothetical protein
MIKMTATNIKVGVEIEAIYNKEKVKYLKIGQYHHPTPTQGLAGWKLSKDGSVNPNYHKPEFVPAGSVEFISSVAMGKKMFFNYLNNFKTFISSNGKYELNEVLAFNQSCGCHIHFSIKDFIFQHKVHYMQFPKVRKFHFDKIKASNILNDTIKTNIILHYQRGFAKKFCKSHMGINKIRRVEFNFTSEDLGLGLELRGINLLGIQTWQEFDEMFNIIWDTLEYLYSQASEWTYNQQYLKSGKSFLENDTQTQNVDINLNKIIGDKNKNV